MTVKELIGELSQLDGDMEILFKPDNSGYAEDFGKIGKRELTSFWGADRDVLVIYSGGQVGGV